MENGSSGLCRVIWDSPNARLSPCAIAYFTIVPVAVISCAWLCYVLRRLPFIKRPNWTRPFVQEASPCPGLPLEHGKHRIGWIIALMAVSIVGLAAEVIKTVLNGPSLANLALLASWAGTVILTTIERPRTSPVFLFTFFVVSGILEAAFIVNRNAYAISNLFTFQLGAAASLVGCMIALAMPLRPVLLPCIDISAVGQKPSSDFRSPEDNLRLWQFLTVSWMAPLMAVGKSRQLDEGDVWYLGFEFQHRRLHEKFRQLQGGVLGRLLQANGIDILIITVISLVQMICEFSTPLLLQQLLQAMKAENRSNRVALVYAVLSLALRLVAAQSQVFNLWYGRRCYERSRGEMMMMVYEKALVRKNVFDQSSDDKSTEDEQSDDGDDKKPSTISWLWSFLTSWRAPRKQKPKAPVTMGKIFNLLRGDVYEVAQRFWDFDQLINQPLGLVIAVVLVWKVLGPSCFLAIFVVLVAQSINALITRTLIRRERVRRIATDARLQVSSQFVEALRHLRWYGWQNHWLRQVMEARDSELKLRVATRLWGLGISFVNVLASGLFSVVALWAYTFLAGHSLSIDVIFPALQLFTMLDSRLRAIPNLITTLINASIAMERIQDFMTEPEKENRDMTSSANGAPLHLEACSFAWPGKTTAVISDIDLSIAPGLTVVYGKVGAGKTALLQGLLGELDMMQGKSYISSEMMGYCAQTPWLQSMSIRDNILFSSPYDEQRYKRVLDACALLPDLASFKHGDLSFVGENGIGLSGGQKARVALARAVYSTARILLLDDPLSALDHNTAETIVRRCLTGPLMEGRVVILVTHRIHLVRHLADQIVHIQDGRAIVEPKSSLSLEEVSDETRDIQSPEDSDATELEDHSAAVPSKFIEEEHRAEWGVKAAVYWNYVKAGRYRWWIALIIIISIYRLTAVAQSWFLKEWGEAYTEISHVFGSSFSNKAASGQWTTFSALPQPLIWTPPNPLDRFPAPIEDVRPWLLAFLGITTFTAITMVVAQLFMLAIVYSAGQKLFQEVMANVSHATFRFFDVTPVGRLMNRLTSDIGVVDGDISSQFQMIAFLIITWASSVLVIASVTPLFLAFSVLLTAAFVFTFLQFLPTSQSLRRLEMVSLSPLISNFGELLHGLTTVRAFHAEPRFQDRVIGVVDKFQGMDHFYWSLQSWLSYRFESYSALSTFALTALALYTDVTPGLAAFVLIAANSFVNATHGLCRQYGQLQMDFVSVERIDELLHVDQEPPGTVEPPASWPKFGADIVFEDVSIRYAPHLDPSLNNISLRIPGGTTTALIGRTGSGKSTLAISLLAAVAPSSGRILIDNIDISTVNKQSLRTRVTFVAQDPVLFPGSIRKNLDPISEYTDAECLSVLSRICARRNWTLDTRVEAGGRNLSQGERQLIGLARAVLRRSSLVILDEATASIDQESSLEIQTVLREEMRESTVVTIAHRIEAIKDANYFVELDGGRVAREGFVKDM